MPTYHAFTSQANALVNRLVNNATLEYKDKRKMVVALWDTGATVTCISTEAAKSLGMIATGRRNINTPSGSKTVNTYLVNVILPNNVRVKDVVVCDSDIGNQGIDMLIGMDIILLGDLSVSSFGKRTTFTFRTPSKEVTSYVQLDTK